jgi:hypothetical protein
MCDPVFGPSAYPRESNLADVPSNHAIKNAAAYGYAQKSTPTGRHKGPNRPMPLFDSKMATDSFLSIPVGSSALTNGRPRLSHCEGLVEPDGYPSTLAFGVRLFGHERTIAIAFGTLEERYGASRKCSGCSADQSACFKHHFRRAAELLECA